MPETRYPVSVAIQVIQMLKDDGHDQYAFIDHYGGEFLDEDEAAEQMKNATTVLVDVETIDPGESTASHLRVQDDILGLAVYVGVKSRQRDSKEQHNSTVAVTNEMRKTLVGKKLTGTTGFNAAYIRFEGIEQVISIVGLTVYRLMIKIPIKHDLDDAVS